MSLGNNELIEFEERHYETLIKSFLQKPEIAKLFVEWGYESDDSATIREFLELRWEEWGQHIEREWSDAYADAMDRDFEAMRDRQAEEEAEAVELRAEKDLQDKQEAKQHDSAD